MKVSKFLLSLLLTLPIFILAIVLYSSTIIGFVVPRPISDIKVSLDNFNYQKNLLVDFDKTNTEKNIFIQIYPFKARSNKIEVYNLNDDICALDEIVFDENGLAKTSLKSLNYGFSEITIKTIDGSYKTTIDINVLDKNKDPNEFLGVSMEYKEKLDNYLIFGDKNHLDVKFKYYPKTAKNDINKQLSFSSNSNIVKVKDNLDGTGVVTLDMVEGINFLSIKANSTNKFVKYYFNTKKGYNYQLETTKELNSLLDQSNNIYLLNNLISTEKIKVRNNSNINGNRFKITFKEDYKENIGVEVKGPSILENLNIEGPLVEKNHQILPLENFVGLYLENNKVDKIVIKNLKVENGRYNIYVKGKAYFDKKWNPANFIISETELVGSLYAGILVDSAEEISLFVNSTNLDLNDIKFKYCSVGILIKNSSSNIAEQSKGFNVININKSQKNKKYSIDIFENWTNVEQSSGLIGKDIFSLLSKEMKNFPDVIHVKNDFSYVNCLIVKYGGIVNKSIVNIEPETNNFLVKKIKKPSISESFLPMVGGTYQFEVYFLLNQFYEYKGE